MIWCFCIRKLTPEITLADKSIFLPILVPYSIDSKYSIAPDKASYNFQLQFFLFQHKNVCCGYWLQVPQHMFTGRNEENIYMILPLTGSLGIGTFRPEQTV